MKPQYLGLGKTLIKALRHRPEDLGIQLDPQGWTSLSGVLEALRKRTKYKDATLGQLKQHLRESDKKRYEIDEKNNRIRAYYGHSIEDRIEKTPATPPEILYHGTSDGAAEAILKDGIKPMGRQYAHLTTTRRTAYMNGRRKQRPPVMFIIEAGKAHRDGVKFYTGNEDIWLSDDIPARYVYHENDVLK